MLPTQENLPLNLNCDASEIVSGLSYVSRETFERLEKFSVLLKKWNKAINLIGKSEEDIWNRHILDSVQLFPYLKKDTHTLTDFGSGAGFPAIILSILGVPEVHLIESDQRKSAFLIEASRLSAYKVVIHNERIEAINAWPSDVITARALASLPKLLELVAPFAASATQCLFLKGANTPVEVSEAEKEWQFSKTLHPSITARDSWIIELHDLSRKVSNE